MFIVVKNSLFDIISRIKMRIVRHLKSFSGIIWYISASDISLSHSIIII